MKIFLAIEARHGELHDIIGFTDQDTRDKTLDSWAQHAGYESYVHYNTTPAKKRGLLDPALYAREIELD